MGVATLLFVDRIGRDVPRHLLGLLIFMCLETIIEAIVMLQCKAAGGEVSGHVRGGLGVHYSSALYGSDSAAVCGA